MGPLRRLLATFQIDYGKTYTWKGAQYICTFPLLATEQLHSSVQVL